MSQSKYSTLGGRSTWQKVPPNNVDSRKQAAMRTSNNWRKPDTVQTQDVSQALSKLDIRDRKSVFTTKTSVRELNGRPSYYVARSKPSGYRYENIKLGMIINTAHAIPSVDCKNLQDPTFLNDDEELLDCDLGALCVKYRYMLVIAKFADHMACVPFYSFTNRGLNVKPEQVRHEYMQLKKADNKDFKNISNYRALEYDLLNSQKAINFESSAIHMTGSVHVFYGGELELIGKVTTESIAYAQEIHDQLTKSAYRGIEGIDYVKPQ
ncbi:hypothetical protein M501DRAFT_1032765 [Patellaria atrata CBS 101060]|uniref:Uncharacterized protein n=1 Tax=Patellaria atrata CBS 101060 TaxID=1346257 RepID=A0A9P4S7G8_9PEZI|nr:hypothetical protein M501DRAFT_1032765 [Patellaria atrata CBS 101060]